MEERAAETADMLNLHSKIKKNIQSSLKTERKKGNQRYREQLIKYLDPQVLHDEEFTRGTEYVAVSKYKLTGSKS